MENSEKILEVNYRVLAENYRQLKTRHRSEHPLWSVVKGNAYGHGLTESVGALMAAGCQHFAVFHHGEASKLRGMDTGIEILLLGPCPGYAVGKMSEENIALVCGSLAYCREIMSSGDTFENLHLKLETGMHRLGILVEEKEELLALLRAQKPEGTHLHLCTHLSAAPWNENEERVGGQIGKFEEWLRFWNSCGMSYESIHLNNSINFPFQHGNYGARIGIALYGCAQSAGNAPANYNFLTPAMELRSRIMDTKTVPKGKYIGYNLAFRTKRDSRLGFVPIGYADGYPRNLGNRAQVLSRDGFAPIIGQINMNFMCIDITELPDLKRGDEIILIGENGQGAISAIDLAEQAGSIPYEILCGLGNV